MPFLKHVTFLCHQKWSSVECIAKISAKLPILFLSGNKDELIPPSMMKELRDVAFKNRTKSIKNDMLDVKLHWQSIAGGTHNDTCIKPGYFESIDAFWVKYST